MTQNTAQEMLPGILVGETEAGFIASWRQFYAEVFPEISAMYVNTCFEPLQITERPKRISWLLVMLGGLTLDIIYEKCSKRFYAFSYYHDKSSEVISARKAENTYALWICDCVLIEDVRSFYWCSNDTGDFTLEERLLLGLWYNWRTNGHHLDTESCTICMWSRDKDGDYPLVRYRGNAVQVSYHRGNATR